jgi:cytochrome bd-type quinol oxidase subunit 1
VDRSIEETEMQDPVFWWYQHLSNMLASYIAAWTAFCVVTIGRLVHGGWVIWVLPTAIGVPAIASTTGYYKRKFTRPEQVGAASTA